MIEIEKLILKVSEVQQKSRKNEKVAEKKRKNSPEKSLNRKKTSNFETSKNLKKIGPDRILVNFDEKTNFSAFEIQENVERPCTVFKSI